MKRQFAAVALAATLAAACQSTASTNIAGAVDTHDAMVAGINPAALTIWDVAHSANQEAGGWNPALMNAAAWSRLQDAARALEQHSRRMALADTLYVGAHDDEIEGFASRAEIQAMIDADPQGFRDLARKMADDAGELLDAAMARNARRSAELADSLSSNCGACHSRYWERRKS